MNSPKQNTFTLPQEKIDEDLACFIFLKSVEEAEKTEEEIEKEIELDLKPPKTPLGYKLDMKKK